ncbi:MAG: hypothetical protein ACI8XO_002463 [Verrucomicrobiales bacterium]|jgi:hypothetical protein
MSPDDEPEWIILHCPTCAAVSKSNPYQAAIPTCPTCGTHLSREPAIPNPSELGLEAAGQEEEELLEIVSDRAVVPNPSFGGALITQLGSDASSDPQLDPTRLKSTSDEDLASVVEERIRVKRSSKRVKKELTSWDGGDQEGAEDDGSLGGGRRQRLDRRLPSWLKWLKIAAIAAVPVAFVGLAAYGLVVSLKNNDVIKPRAESTPASKARAALSDLEAAALDRQQSQQAFENARLVAEKFLDAPNWQKRLAFVREPERVRPLMERHYARPENPDGPFVHRPMGKNGKVVVHRSLMLLTVETEERDRLPLAVERIDEDTYLVDWESFVGHNEVPWMEIDTLLRTEPFVLRARIRKREYYNYGFQDSDWSSWQLEDRPGDHRLFGYVDRGGPLDTELFQHIADAKGSVYILLKVRYPQDAPAGDQLEITEVIAKGWIQPKKK